MKGLSCHLYSDAVVPMTLSPITITLNDLTLTVVDASFSFIKDLNWSALSVLITSSETACSKN